jgi:glycosyltransferase involved in cell wall biosynthesis
MNQITIALMVKNAEKNLKETLEAIKNFPKIVILDTGSTDNTLAIIQSYPQIRLFHSAFEGFGKTRNILASYVDTDWILQLDADEVPSKEFIQELNDLNPQDSFVYAITRDNYFWGQHMKGCSGWYPDYVPRLYNKRLTKYSLDFVHEKVITDGFKIVRLNSSVKHTPYPDLKAMLAKMNHYSDLFVKNTNKKASRLSPITHALFAFFKSYILKLGITQGYRGYVLSKYMADTAFYKYLKLYEAKKIKSS